MSLTKLKSLMEGEKIKFEEILKTVDKFNKCDVLVVGDTIIDTYVDTSLIGNNAKTPTFSTKYINEKDISVALQLLLVTKSSRCKSQILLCPR